MINQRDKRNILIAIGLLSALSLLMFFVSTNINPSLGTIYNGLALLSIAIIIADQMFGTNSIKFINKSVSWGKAAMWGIGGYIVLIFSTHITSYLAEIIPLTEILSLLSATAPVYSNSPIFNFITFAFAVSILESYALFVAFPDLMGSIFNIELSKRNIFNPKVILMIISTGIIFLFLHITSKGIQSETVLLLVFVLAVISTFMSIWTQDSRSALFLHILANTIAATAIFSIVAKVSLPLVGAG